MRSAVYNLLRNRAGLDSGPATHGVPVLHEVEGHVNPV